MIHIGGPPRNSATSTKLQIPSMHTTFPTSPQQTNVIKTCVSTTRKINTPLAFLAQSAVTSFLTSHAFQAETITFKCKIMTSISIYYTLVHFQPPHFTSLHATKTSCTIILSIRVCTIPYPNSTSRPTPTRTHTKLASTPLTSNCPRTCVHKNQTTSASNPFPVLHRTMAIKG